jgi:hypothetical protein
MTAPPTSADAPTPADRRRPSTRGVAVVVAVTLLPLLAAAVPYYKSVRGEYDRYHAYVEETLTRPASPPAWEGAALGPPACVEEAIRWAEACPATKEFCKGSVPEVMRRCLGARDHGEWCAAQDQGWLTTNFGFHDCAALLEGLDEKPAKARKGLCAAGWRAIGRHCIDLQRATAG